jgi:hypothetical protein
MSKERERPLERPRQDGRLKPEIIGAATQGIIRAALDILIWWIDRGGRL